jgi:chemotaxis protein CheD
MPLSAATAMDEAGAAANARRIHLIQGEQRVSGEEDVVLSTLLGSCVAACLYDPVARVGGMNHFLLPGDRERDGDGVRIGVHAMELLVNELLRNGARRQNLVGKLFGGARMLRGLTDVGEMNAAFAERFLQREGIPLVGGSLRGERGRRIQFWPVNGRARQALMEDGLGEVFDRERRAPPKLVDHGAVELF